MGPQDDPTGLVIGDPADQISGTGELPRRAVPSSAGVDLRGRHLEILRLCQDRARQLLQVITADAEVDNVDQAYLILKGAVRLAGKSLRVKEENL